MNRDQELREIERTLWTNDGKVGGVIIFPEVGRIDLEVACRPEDHRLMTPTAAVGYPLHHLSS